jgi:hypothetical protein
MSQFDYLIERVGEAPFTDAPYRHVYIDALFKPEHLTEILATPEIRIPSAINDEDLFEKLFDAGYKIINFPGCIIDRKKYIEWHKDRSLRAPHHSACEGFGVTLRLETPRSALMAELKDFLSGDAFNAALASKFGVVFADTTVDHGVQKYLDGYEISPHPDIRKKALTYMVNINPHPLAEALIHHTHYMQFRAEHAYVQSFWATHEDVERCWVPWDWCETHSVQTKNNSMVIFAPSDNTLHAVKAAYDHLGGQRTQLYGNLWYKAEANLAKLEWEDLDLRRRVKRRDRLVAHAPSLRGMLKSLAPGDANVIRDRMAMKERLHPASALPVIAWASELSRWIIATLGE